MPGFEVIGEEERAAVNEVFEDGGVLFRHGFDGARTRYRVREFEEQFADWLGVRHALAVSSGTAALRVALAGLRVGPGDEVITQAFTFVATVEAIVEAGAKPVLANVDDTLNMDPEDLEGKLSERTRAILPVHMLGVACEVDRIRQVADDRGLPVLDDACESLGAEWGDEKLGAGATAAAWSFDHGKVVTTGEGGMVTTDDDEIASLCREYHDHGHEDNPELPRGRDTRRIHGFNFRMSELQGAVGQAQLAKLDSMVERNRHNYARLEKGLEGLAGVRLRRVPERCRPLCDTLIFELPERAQADELVRKMGERGLGTKNLPDALDWHFAGGWDHLAGAFGMTAEELAAATAPSRDRLERAIALPVMLGYTDERVDEIAGAVRDIHAEVAG